MSKFTIKCPQCGNHIPASTSIFARKTIACACGCVIDIHEQVKIEKMSEDGIASIIMFDGDNDALIWKHPIEDFNAGSQLIVHESQEAIFFRDGEALDLFGAGRYTLTTESMPILDKLYNMPTNTDTPFHSEVYFINKAVQMAIKWGTPDKVRFIDPLTGVPLALGASGEMNIQVADSRKLLLKLVGTMNGIAWGDDGKNFAKSIQSSFRPMISNAVKTNLSAIIKKEQIDLLEIDEKLDLISDCLKEKIVAGFEEYGLTIPQFYVTNIVLPEDDPNFKRIRDLHAITLQTRVIQAEAGIRVAQAQSETLYRTEQERSAATIEAMHREAELQRQMTETEIAKKEAERRVISAQADVQAQRMAGLAEAEVMRAKGYTEKDVIQADVQKAYAESIGNMGPVVSSGGGSGIVGDMFGLGVGMAAASAISPQINTMLQGFQPQSVQPQAPADSWNCSCGNTATGMFCNNCGNKKPEPVQTWDCSCGNKGIVGNFCNLCGAKKPEVPETWNCTCGNMNIVGNFCNMCGKKKGE